MHGIAIDDGSNSDYSTYGGSGFPVIQAAPLDRWGSAKGLTSISSILTLQEVRSPKVASAIL